MLQPLAEACSYEGRNPIWGSDPTARPGLHASCLKFIRESDCCLLVWDMMDFTPNGYDLAWSVHGSIWIGHPTPNHHSRVPVPRQSREDVAGRQRPVCRICRAPSDAELLGNSSWFLQRATGWALCSASPVTFAVLSIIWNAGPDLVLVENVPKARRPRVPPELSRTARRFPFDANFRWTTPVERYVPELSFNDTKIVTKWAILGRE